VNSICFSWVKDAVPCGSPCGQILTAIASHVEERVGRRQRGDLDPVVVEANKARYVEDDRRTAARTSAASTKAAAAGSVVLILYEILALICFLLGLVGVAIGIRERCVGPTVGDNLICGVDRIGCLLNGVLITIAG
jgi:hypothetical protein